MRILYMQDRTLEQRIDTLTYRELREMLPDFHGQCLPTPKALWNELRGRFLEVVDDDYRIRIYTNGLYLYREPGGATVYPVSKCAKIAFPSVEDGLHVTDMRDFVWFLPLKIAGEFRVDNNRSSREEYWCPFHFEEEIPEHLMPCTSDFVRETDQDAEERAYRERYASMMSALNDLTERQREVLTLYRVEGMKMSEIAESLGVCKSTISITIQRAEKHLNAIF